MLTYDDLLYVNRCLRAENLRLHERVRELQEESNRRATLLGDMAATSDRMKLDLILGGALSVPKKA